MTLPIGLQLYSVRDQLAQDFENTLTAVAKMGYVGVEMAGLHGKTPAEVARILANLNLQVAAMHTDVLTPDGLARSLDEAAALGTKKMVCAWRPPEIFTSLETIKALADELNAANATLQTSGYTLLYHNHDFEFSALDSRPALYAFVELLDPTIQLELDLYWVTVAGYDAVAVMGELGSRIGLVHVKDGHISPSNPMTALGDGKLDYAPIVAALPASVPWLLFEMDQCATDVMEAVGKSAAYLIDKGLGHGRQ